jgi:KaiC/GvpD/RAD55 family RecA-like ATPase
MAMQHTQYGACSPLRILEGTVHGGLRPGELGVVMARAGQGKTAFLVHVAIDAALRERLVLHLALAQRLEHVHGWYDGLFDDLARAFGLDDREAARTVVNQHRVIQAIQETAVSAERVAQVVDLFRQAMPFTPAVIVVDGYDWGRSPAELQRELDGLKRLAAQLGAELWLSAQTHRTEVSERPQQIVPPCDGVADLIDLALSLQPVGRHLGLRLLKGRDRAADADTHLLLDPDTLRLLPDAAANPEARLAPSAFTVLSGGAPGAEAEFGASAERYGVGEANYSFPGHHPVRRRGLVLLAPEELHEGAVSTAYLRSHLRRDLPDNERMRDTLHSIWHQVVTAGEVFVIGSIQDDDSVRGGTGWAVELARHLHKRLFVFDQDKGAWFTWSRHAWVRIDAPRITEHRFTGTGTKHLNDAGKLAIERLFARTFAAE